MTKLNVIIVGKHIGDYTRWIKANFEEKRDLTISYIQNKEDINKVKEASPLPDLIIFTGGADVNPRYYAENLGKFTSCNTERDDVDFEVAQTFRSIPKLGICRGSQFLTVQAGGKLIQHVTGHTQSHPITTRRGNEYKMTSTHHQMCYPYDINGYKLLAWSTRYRSATYLDGNNKEIELPGNFLEPEIMYYPNTNALAIQGHPEFGNCPKETSEFCIKLVEKLLKGEL